jgi:hypothetical protein
MAVTSVRARRWVTAASLAAPRISSNCQKALSLFFLGEVEEELDDAGSVTVEVFLQIHDRTISVEPDLLVVMRGVRDCFATENHGVYAGD